MDTSPGFAPNPATPTAPRLGVPRCRLSEAELAALEKAHPEEQDLLHQMFFAYGKRMKPEEAVQATTSPIPKTLLLRRIEAKSTGAILYAIMKPTSPRSRDGKTLAEPPFAQTCEYALIHTDELDSWAKEVLDPEWRALRHLEPLHIP